MIGKYEWFKRRKYTGWGFTPATWQGWVYIIVLVLPLILLTNIGSISSFKIILMVIWGIIFAIDFVDIIIHLPKDERDRMHEAIAERNALWAILAVLTIGVGYQASSGSINGLIKVDPVILIAIAAGLVVKIISNIYLDKKD